MKESEYPCVTSGPGLDPVYMQKRLFTPFSRSDKEAAGNAPGVGLGLSKLCRRLAREMGGDLAYKKGGAGRGVCVGADVAAAFCRRRFNAS